MRKIKYNQFQSLYKLSNGKKVILDFIYNKIEIFDENVKIEYEYDVEYDNLCIKFNNILHKKLDETLYITFITSLECNMHCVYCYEKNTEGFNYKLNKKVNIEDIIFFIEKEYIKNSYKYINVTILGGEPLLDNNIDKITKFIDGINKINGKSHFSIISNGVNVEKYIDKIVYWKINDIQITLDGTQKIHNDRRKIYSDIKDSFSIIVRGIDTLCDNNIKVFLRMNVDENNVSNISDFANFIMYKRWLQRGVIPYIYPVTTSGDSSYILNDSEIIILKKVLNELKVFPEIQNVFKLDFHGIDYVSDILNCITPKIKTRFCGVAQGQYVITCEGNILNCWWGITEDIFKIGEFIDKDFLIDRKKVSYFRERNILSMSKCIKCKFKYICGGGCTYKEYKTKNTVNSGHCYQYDKLIKEYLDYAIS